MWDFFDKLKGRTHRRWVRPFPRSVIFQLLHDLGEGLLRPDTAYIAPPLLPRRDAQPAHFVAVGLDMLEARLF